MLGEGDHYEIDEIIGIGALFSVFMAVYSLQRWREIYKLLRKREKDELLLREVNKQLLDKTEELEKEKSRSEKLSELTNYLQVCKSKDEAFHFIREAAETLLGECHGALYVARDSRNQLTRVAECGDIKHVDFFVPDDCWGLGLGRRFVSSSDLDSPTCTHADDKNDLIHVCYPLTAYGEMIGFLRVEIPRAFKEEKKQSLEY